LESISIIQQINDLDVKRIRIEPAASKLGADLFPVENIEIKL
jgi:hypothetical protein